MKRQVLISATLLLMFSGGLAPGAIAATESLRGDELQGQAENATSSPLKQNAERDRQRQRDAAQRERDRQRRDEMQERWEEDREDDRRDDRWFEQNRDRWEESEDYWEDRDSQQERDRADWEEERGDRDWERNSRYWEDQRRDWENQQRDWENRRDWEFRHDWWRSNLQSTYPYIQNGTRLDLTSLSSEWVTVLIESVEGQQELSFTGSNTQQSIYLTPGAYRIRFRPTLSSRSWRSGYLTVRQTESIRMVFDQDRDLVQVYDDPTAWVGE